MPSKLPALIDYLVTAFTSAATLGAATPPVTIFDGPPTTLLDAPLKLYVGLTDPDSDTVDEAAAITQARGDMGFATRDEVSEIRCCAEAWAGTDDMPTVRHAVFGIVAAVEALVRADNNVGGLGFQAPGVAAGALLQNNTDHGAIARVPFTIKVRSFT